MRNFYSKIALRPTGKILISLKSKINNFAVEVKGLEATMRAWGLFDELKTYHYCKN